MAGYSGYGPSRKGENKLKVFYLTDLLAANGKTEIRDAIAARSAKP